MRSSAASPKHTISSDGHIPTGSPSLILVAVDASVTRQMVVNYLEAHQMRALGAPGREAMMSHLAQSEPDLAILDLRLGHDNGLDLLRDIRSRTDVPVIIVADERRDEIDRVVGLELGADDCVTTPFGIRELLARVRAVLRRNARRLAPPLDPARGRCRFGGWQLDRRSRRLTNPDGAPVPLTKAEYALLIAFLDAPQARLPASIFCRRPACTRMCSTAASTCRSCGCGASSRPILERPVSSRRSAVSATRALCRSSLPDVRASPQAAPRPLEASWPCPTAGTPRARPMRRPYGEPIAVTS